MPKNQKRVLVALGWYDYRLHRGIEKFAQEHHWHLSANLAREKVIPWGWEGDGISPGSAPAMTWQNSSWMRKNQRLISVFGANI